ncbi:MAG: DUF4332 domain-containing protein, partial [Pseudomonadota bacterium]
HYQTLIDHYNLEAGVKDPRAGLDQRLLDIFADLLAYATSGVATLFKRAFAEAQVAPPETDLDLPGYLAALDIPIRKLTRRIEDRQDRKQVEAMYDELQRTGKVLKTLPDDDRAIRRLHCEQVLRRPISEIDYQALEPIGTAHVPLPEHPKPVRYVLKVVPEPIYERTQTPELIYQTQLEAAQAADTTDPHLFDTAETLAPLAGSKATGDTAANANGVGTNKTPKLVPADAVLASIEAEQAALDTAATEVPTPKAVPTPEPRSAPVKETKSALKPVKAETDEVKTVVAMVESKPTKSDAPAPKETAAEIAAPKRVKPETSTTAPAAAAKLAEVAAKPAQTAKPNEIKVELETDEADPERERLSDSSPVVEAPSIGPKTAARLEGVNIHTIGDLLTADPEATASALSVRYITKKTLRDWQDQTRLMLEAPGLRVLDSQILVGAGIRSADDLAKSSAKSVLEAATNFLDTPGGARVLWGADNTVGEQEVKQWIDCAKSVRN